MSVSLFKLLFAALILVVACKRKPSAASQKETDSVTLSAPSATYPSETDSASMGNSVPQKKIPFPYDVDHPDNKYQMPKSLKEISAVDAYKKTKLLCVEDEDGTVFVYDVKDNDVKRPIHFGKKGDYEGIAHVGDTVYVLSSNGKIHQILYFDSPEQKTTVISTTLDKDNDTEGLCFDSLNHRLLIACKKKPGAGLKGARAVYSFDLRTMTFNSTPVYVLKLDELKSFLLQTDKEKFYSEEIKNLFDPNEGDLTFQPSEIAIHPITGDVYLISTVGKLMVVLDHSGQIKFIQSLSSNVFKQPEGLCFKRDGTMFISDEGRSGHGNILEIKYRPDAK